MQEDLKGLEPTLNAEAGSTEEAAKHAGTHGYVDKELHAGFITKQTGLPAATHEHVELQKAEYTAAPGQQPVTIEAAEPREPTFGSEAGATEASARAAGSHGVADPDLHAGFITKQTPI